MSPKRLHELKLAADWLGVCVTLSAILLSFIRSWDWVALLLASMGLAMTCVGNIISQIAHRLNEQTAIEREAIIEQMTFDLGEAQEAVNDPHLQRLVSEERMRYEVEHQDDGR